MATLGWRTFFCIVAFHAAAVANDIGAEITGRVSIPTKFQQAIVGRGGLSAAKVIVDGGRFQALPTADGYFSVPGVSLGAHLLEVVHPVLCFDPVLVEAQLKGGTPRLNAFLTDLEHGKGAKLKYPLGLAPSETYQYFEKREDFNILSIFKSPMAIMGVFCCAVTFVLPKLQPMLEEEKARQREAAEVKDEK
eukprot:TRINITY_DN14533_c0_g1_i1.p1 TRINITY_DN14533_c0_g1~~TRINITY_DN14533_c0_g1_i1.p1  ORF type:complete len:212 (+),score=51.99 TRINITY_DN14533_c0_g1_i1:62-637(+)